MRQPVVEPGQGHIPAPRGISIAGAIPDPALTNRWSRPTAPQAQIAHGPTLQRAVVGVSLAALLSLSLAPGEARATASSKSAQIRVSATVGPYVRLDVVRQQPSLTITTEDLARGYVDAVAGTSLRMRTNDRNGVLVVFDFQSEEFERVRVTGIGGTVEIGSAGGSVRAAYSGAESFADVSYRFYLTQRMRAGTYPWPLQISASVDY